MTWARNQQGSTGGQVPTKAISFSTDMVEGKPLPAGTYGLFIAMGDGDATIIFSNNSTMGLFMTQRRCIKVNAAALVESVERLKFEFWIRKKTVQPLHCSGRN
jgi:hypothetical protein